mgnify:CR=1 FL=1|tara:strand:- start:132 stop:740 length:609 start_codon:yes stop_codon:yes gene_type:complete
MIKFQRAWAMPNKRTFKIKPIEDWITRCMIDEIGINWVPQCLRSYMSVFKGANTKTGWIDPFAGDCEVEGGPFFCRETNDLNPKNGAQFCLPAIKYLRGKESASVDGVFFDPPYSPRQIKECYEGFGREVTQQDTQSKFWGDCKKEIARVVKPRGYVFSFGWNSGGIGLGLGFEIKSILLVAHGGWHNDTICVLQQKTGHVS